MNLTTEELIAQQAERLRRYADDDGRIHFPATEPPTATPEPALWHGAAAIAKGINTTEQRAQYLLEKGELPAFKLGGKWALRPEAFRRMCEEREGKAREAGDDG